MAITRNSGGGTTQADAADAATQEAREAQLRAEQEREEAARQAALDARKDDEKRVDAQREAAKAAELNKPVARAKARVKATQYEFLDPTSGIRITIEGTVKKIDISNWLQSQIDAGLAETFTTD